MVGWVVGILVGAWIVLYGLPDVVVHHLQIGGFFGARDSHRLGLTFDDGPGPDTPAILDHLAAAGVRATFFLVAERARAHPALVQRLLAEGHEVGLHARRHVSAFVQAPWTSFREVARGLQEIEAVSGVRPRFFRPPWGHVNLGTWLAMRHFGLVPVFWQIAPDDWKTDRTAARIAQYVVQMAQPGVVAVLHDAGGDRRPTAEALPALIAGVRALGMEPGRVGDLPRDPSYLRLAWTWWEIRFTRGWDIDSVPSARGGDPVLRVGRIRYRGRRLAWDAMSLAPGDALGEIHFGNPALSQLSGGSTGALKAFHRVLSGCYDLAQFVRTRPKYDDVVAFGGITLLDAQAALERLGFHRFPVTGWKKWSMWIYLMVLMAMYHRAGWSTLRRFFRLRPVFVVMSRQELMDRYGNPRTKRA